MVKLFWYQQTGGGQKRTADRGKQLVTLTLFLISCQENNRDRLSSYHILNVWRREGGREGAIKNLVIRVFSSLEP